MVASKHLRKANVTDCHERTDERCRKGCIGSSVRIRCTCGCHLALALRPKGQRAHLIIAHVGTDMASHMAYASRMRLLPHML